MKSKLIQSKNFIAVLTIANDKKIFVDWFYKELNSHLKEVKTWPEKTVPHEKELNNLLDKVKQFCGDKYSLWSY